MLHSCEFDTAGHSLENRPPKFEEAAQQVRMPFNYYAWFYFQVKCTHVAKQGSVAQVHWRRVPT